MNKHFYSITYLRAIASILVCLFHFTNKEGYLSDENLLKSVFYFGRYGVEIFFAISGFIIPYSLMAGNYRSENFFLFMKKRLIRIEPPYLLCILICLTLDYLTTLRPSYLGDSFSLDSLRVISHVGYITPFIGKEWFNPVFWTLGIEFQYYLVIALIFPLLRNRRTAFATLFVFGLLSWCFDMGYSQMIVFYYSLFFSIGVVIYLYRAGTISLVEYRICMVIHLLALYVRFSHIEVFVALVPVLMMSIDLSRISWLVLMGNISFSLYLLHVPFGMRIQNVVVKYTSDELIRTLAIIVALAVSIGVSMLYYRYVELFFKRNAANVKYNSIRDSVSQPVEVS